jgi:hypothetical protein
MLFSLHHCTFAALPEKKSKIKVKECVTGYVIKSKKLSLSQ